MVRHDRFEVSLRVKIFENTLFPFLHMKYLLLQAKISLSHGKDIKTLRQQMRKYIDDLVVDLQQFGIIKPQRKGTDHCCCCCFCFWPEEDRPSYVLM